MQRIIYFFKNGNTDAMSNNNQASQQQQACEIAINVLELTNVLKVRAINKD